MTLAQITALRNIVENCDRKGFRHTADALRGVLAMEPVPEDERMCAVQARGTGVTAIPWGLAELLHPAYGHDQTLERMHERGGFGRLELGALAVDGYSALGGGGDRGQHRLQRWPILDLYEAAKRNGGTA